MDYPRKLTTLPNGLRVLTIPIDKAQSPVIYLEFQILAGLFYETPKYQEAAHFLEHLNGHFTSNKYPDASQLNRLIEGLGANSNASVGRYQTSYYIYGQSQDTELLLDILLESYLDFIIDQKIFKQEKKSIVEELNEMLNQPWIALDEKVDALLYPGHPGAVSIKDRLENLKGLTAKDLLTFRKRHYHPEHTVLVVAGDFKTTPLLKLIRSYFSADASAASKTLPQPAKFNLINRKKVWSSPVVYVPDSGSDSTKLQVIYRLPQLGGYDQERFPMGFICSLLTGGLSSRLMQLLRTKMGLIYSINCNYYLDPQNRQMSYFGIETTTDAKSAKRVAELIQGEIDRLKEELVPEAEFQKILNQVKTGLYSSHLSQKPGKFAGRYSDGLLWNQPIRTFDWMFKQETRVTPKILQKLARDSFSDPKMRLIAYSGKQKITL